ncbi:MAG: hypothetical protein ABSF24_02465 [Candidatus Bathyarchaeia archaeon]
MTEPLEIKPYKRQKIHPPSESTAIFVKDFLLKHGKGYSYGMWKAWSDHLHSLGFKEPKIESFRKYLWILTKLGLIRKTKAPSYKIQSRFLREYYELNPKQIGNEKAWANPSFTLYGDKARLGRRRYRKRILGLPPKKVGRPKTRWVQSNESSEQC